MNIIEAFIDNRKRVMSLKRRSQFSHFGFHHIRQVFLSAVRVAGPYHPVYYGGQELILQHNGILRGPELALQLVEGGVEVAVPVGLVAVPKPRQI